jgi:4-hydroxybenzoate polyprenyltransferase
LFDYRDREEDKKEGIKSMITHFSEKGIKALFYSSLIIFFISLAGLYLSGMPVTYCTALLIPGLIVALLYKYAKQTATDYFYYFFLDGLMMFSAVLLYIFSFSYI